jgi:hypothetical protein
MTLSTWTVVVAALLSGAATGAFILLVIGIRTGDRARHLADQPGTRLDAITRTVMGVGIRSSRTARASGTEEQLPADARNRSDYPCR